MDTLKNDASPAESDLPIDQNPTEVFATFKINAPANMQTKATNSGTAEETAVKTLHVFIYDVASPHAPTIASFSTDANTLINSGNSWTASTPIRTLKADKYIFAGINLTPAIINEITSRGLGAFSYKEFEQSISDLTNPTDGFVMFNTTYPAVTPGDALATSAEAAKANPISIPVSRVVAKAAVVKSTSFVVNGGGTMQNITYGWRNIKAILPITSTNVDYRKNEDIELIYHNVYLNSIKSATESTITFYPINGNQAYTLSLSPGVTPIPDYIPSGFYILKIVKSNNDKTYKAFIR